MAWIADDCVLRKRLSFLPLLISGLFFAIGSSTHAQTNAPQSTAAPRVESVPDSLPEFEVATIKPLDPKVVNENGINVSPGGTVFLKAFSLKAMICTAFHLSYWQVSGGEEWVSKEAYNVVAKPSASVQASMPNTTHNLFEIQDEHLRQMLQALLIDRFQLKFHRETKTGSVYLLEKSGKTLLLRPKEGLPADVASSTDNAGSIGFAGEWVLSNTTMPQFAKFAGDFYLHRPILERTGLTGAFDYRSPEEDWDIYQADPTGSLLNLIQEMGLKLESSKGPVETFVIDHAEKPSPD